MKWETTKYPGVRYREHATRKHGAVGLDKYFAIHVWIGGKTVDEGIGWSSEGWTAEKAFKLLSSLRENKKSGAGPQTLAELREVNKAEAEAQKAESAVKSKMMTTFSEYWELEYLPLALSSKTPKSIETETGYYRKWLASAIGDIQLQRITPAMIEALVATLQKAGKKPGTVGKVLGVFSIVWNRAKLHDFVTGDCPVQRVKHPKQDDARLRFLTQDEARLLLAALAARSQDMHDIALLSLFAGLRAGEVHGLRWADVDFATELLTILDPKNGKNRHVPIVPEIRHMLRSRHTDQPRDALVFPGKGGIRRMYVSDTFERTVKDLGINDGIADSRQKAVFHTLRHTFGSWLVQAGEPIFNVSKLMGHGSVLITQKYYAHLAPDQTRRTAMRLAGILSSSI
jgi:integrase